MRLLVCGGRDFGDEIHERDALYAAIEKLNPTVLMHGAATGADDCADIWGVVFLGRANTLRFPADWNRYRNAAGPRRNADMLRLGKPDAVLAVPGGKGTADMVSKAQAAGIPVHFL